MTSISVSTFAFDPVMKNSETDWVWAMPKAEATVPSRLAAPPKVVNNASSPVFRDAADSAVRALVQCEPYILPPDKYAGGWEHMILTFDPARMF